MSDFIKEIESELLDMWRDTFIKNMHNENKAVFEMQSIFSMIQCYSEEKIKSDPELVHDELFENDPLDSLPESEIKDKLRNIQHAIENYFMVV